MNYPYYNNPYMSNNSNQLLWVQGESGAKAYPVAPGNSIALFDSESDNKIVGMISIRLKLNKALWNFGGNIGYSIRPSERRKGYNKINLFYTDYNTL